MLSIGLTREKNEEAAVLAAHQSAMIQAAKAMNRLNTERIDAEVEVAQNAKQIAMLEAALAKKDGVIVIKEKQTSKKTKRIEAWEPDSLFKAEATASRLTDEAERVGKLDIGSLKAQLTVKRANATKFPATPARKTATPANGTKNTTPNSTPASPMQVSIYKLADQLRTLGGALAAKTATGAIVGRQHKCSALAMQPCKPLALKGKTCEACIHELPVDCMDLQLSALCFYPPDGGNSSTADTVSPEEAFETAVAIGPPAKARKSPSSGTAVGYESAKQEISTIDSSRKAAARNSTSTNRPRQNASQQLQWVRQAAGISSQRAYHQRLYGIEKETRKETADDMIKELAAPLRHNPLSKHIALMDDGDLPLPFLQHGDKEHDHVGFHIPAGESAAGSPAQMNWTSSSRG
jgi:hypothetical protein